MLAATQLDLIMSQVQQLSPGEQLQVIKRIAELLERTARPPSLSKPNLPGRKRTGYWPKKEGSRWPFSAARSTSST